MKQLQLTFAAQISSTIDRFGFFNSLLRLVPRQAVHSLTFKDFTY